MARPEKINDDIQKTIIDVIRAGNYLETAAAFAGIDVVTIRRWIKRGERELQRIEPKGLKIKQSEKVYVEFCMAIKKAMAEAEMRDVLVIGSAAKENWQAAAWRLERKYPDRWGRKDKHEITGKDGGAIEIEELAAKQKLIDKLSSLSKTNKENG